MGRKSAGKMAPVGRQKSNMLKQNSTDSQQVSRNSDHTVIINIHSDCTNFHYSKRLQFELLSFSSARKRAEKAQVPTSIFVSTLKWTYFFIYSC